MEKQEKSKNPIKMLIVGFSGYCRDLDYKTLRALCDRFNVHLHVDFSHTAGLVAANILNNPFCADSLMCTTHKTLRGPRGALIFSHGDAVDKAVFPGLQGGPHMNNIAAIAQTLLDINEKFEEYSNYQKQVINNRKVLDKIIPERNLFQKGSDNHMLIYKGLKDGSLVEQALETVGIVVNRQFLPGDKKTSSGIRIGTPFVTSQGFKEDQMTQIGEVIQQVLTQTEGCQYFEK